MVKNLLFVFKRSKLTIKQIGYSKQKLLITTYLPYLILVGILFLMLYPMIEKADFIISTFNISLEKYILSYGVLAIFVIGLGVAFVSLLTSCYMDKNLNHYLVLPIPKDIFVLSKLYYVFLDIIKTSYILFIPFIVIYVSLQEITSSAIILIIIYPILLALFNLTLAIMILGSVLFMINKIKNKAVAKLLLYICLYAVIILAYMYIFFTINGNSNTYEESLTKFNQLKEQFLSLLLFPKLAYNIIMNNEYINFLYLFLLSSLIIPGFYYFRSIYYQGAIGFNEVSPRINKRKSTYKNNSIIKWFFMREFKELSSGVYFLNTLFPALIVDIIYLGMAIYLFFFSSVSLPEQDEFKEIYNMINIEGVIIVVSVISIFLTNITFGAATTFSREAYNLDALRVLPINIANAFLGKVIFNSLFDCMSILIIVIPIALMIKLSLTYIIVAIILICLISVTHSFIQVNINLLFPTLDWESETSLVKRSKSVTISSITGMLYIFLAGYSVYYLFIELSLDYKLFSYLIVIYYILLFIIVSRLYNKLVLKAFSNTMK